MTIKNCPQCGGDHFGSVKCPFSDAGAANQQQSDPAVVTQGADHYEPTTRVPQSSVVLSPLEEGLRAWEPISTAPKDGTEILAAVADISAPNGTRIEIILWDLNFWWRWRTVKLKEPASPTHWMPLPAPPDAALSRLREATHEEEKATRGDVKC